MRTLLLIGGMLAGLCGASSQGFDWQYSARTPFESPVRFYGLELGSGYSRHFATLDYLEQGTGFTCCTYERGSGIPYGVLLAGDYWVMPEVSIQGGLGLVINNVRFVSDPISLPREDGTVVTSEYQFDGTITYATLQAGARYRILRTHLNVGAGLKTMIKLSETQTQIDRVLSPDDYFFRDNPPSKEQDLKATILNDASPFILEPYASLSYDLSVFRGTYFTPTVSIGVPLMSYSKSQPWRAVDFGFSVRLLTAF